MRKETPNVQVPPTAKNQQTGSECSVLATQLEDALLSGNRDSLELIHKALLSTLESHLKAASDKALDGIRGAPEGDSSTFQAFEIGQLSFGQLLAGQALARMPHSDFAKVLSDRTYQCYVTALHGKDLAGVDLARITQERPETVSRKLKRLRDLGVTDFRKEGAALVNFLTPAAKACVDTFHNEAGSKVTILPDHAKKIGERIRRLPEHMRQPLTFGRDDEVVYGL